jgi:hypothetical protein
MMTDHELLLIAAAVDADLTPAQANAFHRLVTDRPEAATLFARMKADAARIRALPFVVPPASLTTRVMARVNAAPTATPARRPVRRGTWAPYAVAASALVAVSVGSFLAFRPTPNTGEQVRQTPIAPDRPIVSPPPDRFAPPLAMAKPGPDEPDTHVVAKAGPEPELLPTPDVIVHAPAPAPDLLGAGLAIESKPLVVADLALPVIVSAADFHREDGKAQLQAELARDSALRIDLFSKTPTAALEQLMIAARNAGVNLFVDVVTAERMRKSNGFTFAVYLDNLTAAEHAALFAALAKQVSALPKPEAVLGSAHLIPPTAIEHKDVKELIGVEFGVAKATVKPMATADEPKAVSADTIAKVAQAVKKPGEKAGLVTTYLPANFRVGATKSAEVKHFQEKRGDRKPDAVAVLVVVR